jgi:cell division topological specificity factor
MAGFFDRLLGRAQPKGSRNTAKQRLQFILVHDRINLPPERLQAMKAEILEVLSKYVEVDVDHVDIALEQRERDSLIKAQIPFSGSTEQDEARRRIDASTLIDDGNPDDG